MTKDQEEFLHKAEAKFIEAEFFLQKAREALADIPNHNVTQNEARYYASAALSAARAPVNYFFDDSHPDFNKRTNWYGKLSKKNTFPHVQALKAIRDINTHTTPAPAVTNIVKRMGEPDTGITTTMSLLHDGKDVIAVLERGITQTKLLVERIIAEGRV